MFPRKGDPSQLGELRKEHSGIVVVIFNESLWTTGLTNPQRC
jgi:hypothetical protein